MGYTNVQADVNFYRQSLNADGVKYVTGPYTSLYEDVFRAITVTTDSVVSVTSYVGDSLSNQFLLAGTEIYGLFSSVTIHSGKAVLHLAGASYISEIINQYSASGIPLGFYEEGTQCLSQKISALLTQGVFDDASWVMVPSQYEEDWVRAFKPTSTLGDLAFTRSSDATFTDSTGVVRRSPWNLVTYSEMFSDVAWIKTTTSVTANTITAPNGTLTADTLTASGSFPRVVQNPVVQANQSYRISVYAKSGTASVFTISVTVNSVVLVNNVQYNLSNGVVTGSGTMQPVGDGWYLCSASFTVGASAANPDIRFFNHAQGVTGGWSGTNFIYGWGAQLVEGTEALPYFATTDRLNVPRLDYRNADGTLSTCPRLLLEPQRTNSIRNSSMVGAVAGSPGTLPTNWVATNLFGLNQTIVGIGTENGLPYIDFRFNGTANTTGDIELRSEGPTQIAALNGQAWSHSVYMRYISSVAPPSVVKIAMYERNSGGSALSGGNSVASLTSSLQRFTFTRTLIGGATVAFIQPFVAFSLISGTAYDFTIRIAAPQMELGAFATTWAPTTTAAVTRLADTASKTGVSSLIGQTSGTLFVEWDNSDKGFINLLETYNNTSGVTGTSTILIQKTVTPNQINIRVFDSLGNYNDLINVTLLNGTNKLALAYQPGSAVYYLNGSFVGSNTRTYVFVSTRDTIGFDNRAPYPRAQAALFPVRLDNATLAALTTL